MLQIENEYFGATYLEHSAEYLQFLLNTVRTSGFKELIFTSDPGSQAIKLPIKSKIGNTHEQVFETANFNNNSLQLLLDLKKVQPNRPAFVSEFWPGWFDFWNGTHHTYSVERFDQEMSDILFKVGM